MALYPNDDHVLYKKGDLTIILDTTAEYEIGKNFAFDTTRCLVYAEKIAITSSPPKLPGKSLGLFCSKLRIPQKAILNVSGENGQDGNQKTDSDGGEGKPGKNAGNVWIFIQEFEKDDLNNLEIQAYGGQGGRGGNTSGLGKTGGKGGNSGDGGLIEVVIGSPPSEAIVALRKINKQPWPDKVSSLLKQPVSDLLAGYITAKERAILDSYQLLASVMAKLASAVKRVSAGDQPENVRTLASQVLNQIAESQMSVKKAPAKPGAADQLNKALLEFNSESGLAKHLQKIKEVLEGLSPATESNLLDLIDSLWESVQTNEVLEAAILPKLRDNGTGTPGRGGDSGPGLAPGKRGNRGKDGESRLKFVEMEGSPKDLKVSQAYIFPEQCQMVLNKADNEFFSAGWKEARSSLIKQYERLAKRLNVVDTLDNKTNESLGFWKAMAELEQSSGVTRNGPRQLQTIAGLARSRQNRLLLGQDMFGQTQNWAPRLSYNFYVKSIKDRLQVLKEVEQLEAQYKEAFQKNSDMERSISEAIKKLADMHAEACTKINLLTGSNGSLSQTARKITELSVELREKRENVRSAVADVTFEHHIDPQLLIDGLSTLTSLGLNVKSAESLWKLGKELWKAGKSETIKDAAGNEFEDKLVISQLAECTGSLESLESALKTRENNQISVDDPKGLKVLAKKADIEKILASFKACVPEAQRKKVANALDEYIKVILMRNEAVVGYNSLIQLLVEAIHDRKYAEEQQASLSDKRLALDPTIPAVSFWLRRTRDSLRLQLLQRLDYASRAVQYWGLKKDFKFSGPGPLRSSAELENHRLTLESAFESILNQNAGNPPSTWPEGQQLGLMYDLTDEQLVSLTTAQDDLGRPGEDHKLYTVSITMDPKAEPFHRAHADVRLNKVRLWLVGARVNPDGVKRQRLKVHAQHMGNDIFEDADLAQFTYTHDMVRLSFEFDAAMVKSRDDISSRAVLSQSDALEATWPQTQSRQADSIATIGPFATWRLVVRGSENPGLDMENVVSAHLEFHGASRSFSRYTTE